MAYSLNRLSKSEASAMQASAQGEKRSLEVKISNLDYSQDISGTRAQKLAGNKTLSEADLIGINAAIANTTDPVTLEKLNLEKRKIQNKLEDIAIQNAEMGASVLVRRELELAQAQAELAVVDDFLNQIATYIASLP